MEKLHTQFYKYYIGLNRKAPNVVSRNEVGRLKLWTHLENLPENSIAKQCLKMSTQLAEHNRSSLYFLN